MCISAVAEGESSVQAEQATQAQPEAANEPAPAEAEKPLGVRLSDESVPFELPDNASREQSERFIQAIRDISGEARFSERDPQIQRLSTVPVEHMDLLLRESQSGNNRMAYYARWAISSHEPESYREMAVNGLSEEPDFIYVIARNGWYQDAKEPILAKLKAVDPKKARFKPIWFQAFVEVVEPEHYPLLHEIILGFYDLDNRLQLLQTLPGYDFKKTIDACWEKAKQPDENGKEQVATVLAFMSDRPQKVTTTLRPYAIRAGHVDALDPIINQLNPKRGLVSRRGEILTSTADYARLTVRRHLAFNGTNQEIQTWFRTHRDQLVFNPLTQRFELPED